MKTQKIIMAIFIAGTTLLFSCGDTNTKTESNPAGQQEEHLAYQCPMKCEGDKTYEKSGSCPVCNMNLEKIEHHDHSGHQH